MTDTSDEDQAAQDGRASSSSQPTTENDLDSQSHGAKPWSQPRSHGAKPLSEDINDLELLRARHPASYPLEDDSDLQLLRARAPGPLSQIPPLSSGFVAFQLYALCGVISFAYWTQPWADLLWVSREAISDKSEYWRLFTALFTHADFGHFIANGPMFLIFGWLLRAFFGWYAFPVGALLIGAMANLITVELSHPAMRLVGASGMVYGMVALWLVFYVRFETRFRLPVRLFRVLGFALLTMMPTLYQPRTSYMAHGVGFGLGIATGLVLQFLLRPIHYATKDSAGDTRRDEGASGGQVS